MRGTSHRLRRTGVLLAAALLELAVILYLLLPSGQKKSEPARPAAAAEPPQLEQRLSAGLSRKAEAEEDASGETEGLDAPEPAEEAPEVVEKEKPEGEPSAAEILANEQLIAHGMGAVGDLATLNCLEGFQAQYEAGVRVFEADLRLTRDGKTVLRHDWWPAGWQDGIDWVNIPTREKFLSEKILDKYTPLSFRDLLLLMEEYPDICVITDTKFAESDVFFLQFDSMLADARELGLTYLFDRIAIQVYSGNMRTGLHNIYPFPHYIYTLYQDPEFDGTVDAFRKKAAYCAQRGIEGITLDYYWWRPACAAIAEEYGVRVYVHTVNDASLARKLLDEGCDGVYSDSLTPGDLSGG